MSFSQTLRNLYFAENQKSKLLFYPTYILVIVFHFILINYVMKLHFAWQYGLRLQEHCGNYPMEMETTRYNVLNFVQYGVNSKRIALYVIFMVILAITAFPIIYTFVYVIIRLVNHLLFIAGLPYGVRVGADDINNKVIILACLGVLTVISWILFDKRLGGIAKKNKLEDRLFTDYKNTTKLIKEYVISRMVDCSSQKHTDCTGNWLFQNVADSILSTDQMESLEAAKGQLQKWLDEKNYDKILSYIRFNKYDRSFKSSGRMTPGSDYDAMIRIAGDRSVSIPGSGQSQFKDLISLMSSLTYADPSDYIRRIMIMWKIWIFVVLAVISYFVFHSQYANYEKTTITLVMLLLILLLCMIGYAKYVAGY